MSKTSTKNFEEKVILTAHYKHTNVGINVEKIILIPCERADVRENVKEITNSTLRIYVHTAKPQEDNTNIFERANVRKKCREMR